MVFGDGIHHASIAEDNVLVWRWFSEVQTQGRIGASLGVPRGSMVQ
jgi:hypothetical protein